MEWFGRVWSGMVLVLALAACGGSGTGPDGPAPGITIVGVEAGGTYTAPVTITIAVDRGTYTATLDGQAFTSGTEVSAPGEHVLRVVATAGGASAEAEVAFSLTASGASILVVRMLALGPNDAGGGGDAVLITDSLPGGTVRHALVDAGPGPGGDTGLVARRLAQLGVDTLEYLVLSHAHSDHFEGMPAVLAQVHVKRFVYNGQVRSWTGYTSFIASARAQADTTIVLQAVEEFPLTGGANGATLTLIPALASFLGDPDADSAELNEGSVGGVLRRGEFELFLTGDGEVLANQRWRTQFTALSQGVDVLKVGHHGANDAIFDNGSSGASSWLAHTDPAVAIVSSNGTSHPRIRALQALLARPATATYCTHFHGDIVVRAAPAPVFAVTVDRNATAPCTAGSQATS